MTAPELSRENLSSSVSRAPALLETSATLKGSLLILLSCGLLSIGCQVSASASGGINTGGATEGTVKTAEPAPEPAAPPAPPEPAEKAITYREGRLQYRGVINFEYDKADLRKDPETQQTLTEFRTFLEQHPTVSLEIEGHTDSRGSDDYNRRLSERRAASVRQWLIDQGVEESRLTSVGKGEDEPQVEEPPECNDKEPEDTQPCEAPWATNRRVVFEVTQGAETLPEEPEPVAQAEPEPEPPPPPPAPPPPPKEPKTCRWLFGGHLNALGPNSWAMVAGAVQPGVCWLELSLGVGAGFGDVDAEASGLSADGSYESFTVPLRARIWFMDRHSILGDLGVGFTHYVIDADTADAFGNRFDYSRDSTNFIAHLGVGYGFRPNGSEAGFRLAVLVGGLLHPTDLSDSEASTAGGFDAANAAALQDALDSETDDLTSFEPYAEVSLGLLF